MFPIASVIAFDTRAVNDFFRKLDECKVCLAEKRAACPHIGTRSYTKQKMKLSTMTFDKNVSPERRTAISF